MINKNLVYTTRDGSSSEDKEKMIFLGTSVDWAVDGAKVSEAVWAEFPDVAIGHFNLIEENFSFDEHKDISTALKNSKCCIFPTRTMYWSEGRDSKESAVYEIFSDYLKRGGNLITYENAEGEVVIDSTFLNYKSPLERAMQFESGSHNAWTKDSSQDNFAVLFVYTNQLAFISKALGKESMAVDNYTKAMEMCNEAIENSYSIWASNFRKSDVYQMSLLNLAVVTHDPKLYGKALDAAKASYEEHKDYESARSLLYCYDMVFEFAMAHSDFAGGMKYRAESVNFAHDYLQNGSSFPIEYDFCQNFDHYKNEWIPTDEAEYLMVKLDVYNQIKKKKDLLVFRIEIIDIISKLCKCLDSSKALIFAKNMVTLSQELYEGAGTEESFHKYLRSLCSIAEIYVELKDSENALASCNKVLELTSAIEDKRGWIQYEESHAQNILHELAKN